VSKTVERYLKTDNIISGDISAAVKTINTDFSTHWHDFFEIEFIIGGKGSYIIDGREYTLCNNMLFFMTPINFHSVHIDGEVELVNVMFCENICNSDILGRLISGINENGAHLSSEDASFVRSLLSELVFATNEGNYLYYEYLLNSLLIKISRIMNAKSSRALSHIQKAILFIISNFRNNITLTDTANYVGLSPAYLSSVFSEELGVTFKEYTDRIRLDYAKNILLHSNLSVTDVCFESGFGDYSNFLRKFKNHFGNSPGKLRISAKNF